MLWWRHYPGGIDDFLSSITAPVATDWSETCRARVAPAEHRRLFTAHCRLEVRFTNKRVPRSPATISPQCCQIQRISPTNPRSLISDHQFPISICPNLGARLHRFPALLRLLHHDTQIPILARFGERIEIASTISIFRHLQHTMPDGDIVIRESTRSQRISIDPFFADRMPFR